MLGKPISPSRTYVAICTKTNFDGHYFRKFHLPLCLRQDSWSQDESSFVSVGKPMANTADQAAWYFLNVLNSVACIEGCVAFEDFQDLTDEPTVEEKRVRMDQLMAEARADAEG